MNPVPYNQLSDLQLLALCIWRESRGEMPIAKRAVGCVIRNRIAAHSFFGSSIQAVVLKPYQFSSFNANDPNSGKWPVATDQSWTDSLDEAEEVLGGCDDVSNGALYYFSPPLVAPPHAWGAVVPTAHIGHLEFYKPAPADMETT
jgi:spore germination cell wall hydrolase CwlJ-like protein